MKFWYMQLHPGNEYRQVFTPENMARCLVRYKMIGMGSEKQWGEDGNQWPISKFKEKMSIGDVVMCGDGKRFFALVRVTSNAFYRDDAERMDSDDDFRWFELARNVEVLSTEPAPFENLYDIKYADLAESGRKPHYSHCDMQHTLCEWAKNKFIEFWYNNLDSASENLSSLFEELKNMPETEVVSQATQRRGQDKIRKILLTARQKCEVCSLAIPELLRASHIKPWRDSSNAERLDLENVLLLAANYDAAFDAGFISFSACDGSLLISHAVTAEQLLTLGINSKATIPKPSKKRAKYLEWHNTHVFIR